MHEVLTRRHEFGIRLALGGSPSSIRCLILGDAMRLGAAGIGIGGIVAALGSRAIPGGRVGVTTTAWRGGGAVAGGAGGVAGFVRPLGAAARRAAASAAPP